MPSPCPDFPGGLGMSRIVDRRTMDRWLRAHGWTQLPGRPGGHRYYGRDGHKLTVPDHGPQSLSKAIFARILDGLARAGHDKRAVQAELRGDR